MGFHEVPVRGLSQSFTEIVVAYTGEDILRMFEYLKIEAHLSPKCIVRNICIVRNAKIVSDFFTKSA